MFLLRKEEIQDGKRVLRYLVYNCVKGNKYFFDRDIGAARYLTTRKMFWNDMDKVRDEMYSKVRAAFGI